MLGCMYMPPLQAPKTKLPLLTFPCMQTASGYSRCKEIRGSGARTMASKQSITYVITVTALCTYVNKESRPPGAHNRAPATTSSESK